MPGNLATPPPVQALNLPPMKLEPLGVSYGGRSPPPTSRKPSVSHSNTTPVSGTSSEEEKENRIKKNLIMDRRSSLKTPRVTPASPRDSSLTSASATASPRTRPLYTRRPSASGARKLSLSTVNSSKNLYDEGTPTLGPVGSRARKQSINSSVQPGSRAASLLSGSTSRKNSVASMNDQEVDAAKDLGSRK